MTLEISAEHLKIITWVLISCCAVMFVFCVTMAILRSARSAKMAHANQLRARIKFLENEGRLYPFQTDIWEKLHQSFPVGRRQ